MLHSTTPPGDEVPAHVHHHLDECFFVIEGHYRVRCGEDTFEAEPGSLWGDLVGQGAWVPGQ